MDGDIASLAREAGILLNWLDAAGAPMEASEDAVRGVLEGLGVPCRTPGDVRDSLETLRSEAKALRPLYTADAGGLLALPLEETGPEAVLVLESGEERPAPRASLGGRPAICAPDVPGYHTLRIGEASTVLAVAPSRAFTPEEALGGGRGWGVAVQVYALNEEGRGFGGFDDLAAFAEAAARSGADAVALSPTHALFLADPSRYSPYAPSSRLTLNGLFAAPPPAAAPVRTAGSGSAPALINWEEAWPRKKAVLEASFEAWRAQGGLDDAAFLEFVTAGGETLLQHARFEALSEAFVPDGGAGFPSWPQPFQDPASPETTRFLKERPERVRFHLFIQWLADRSLADAQARARRAGMRIGLITDLAVGTDPGGSHAWGRPGEVLQTLSIGAPPDLFQADGQDWGVAAIAPRTLKATAYRGFLETIRTALRHAGGVRIDHAMGLERLWLVPRGARAKEGAYLSFPREDLLKLLALESRRSRAVVVAEDLGTVPPGFSEALADRGVVGMGVLWFEQAKGRFLAPGAWPKAAVAMTSTHDLPTVAGWWSEHDLAWRARAGQLPDPASETETRAEAKQALWGALVAAGEAEGAPPEEPDPVVDAVVGFLAQTPAALAIVPVEDLAGEEEQVNLPGDVSHHPNWRRRLKGSGSDLFTGERVRRRTDRLNARKSS